MRGGRCDGIYGKRAIAVLRLFLLTIQEAIEILRLPRQIDCLQLEESLIDPDDNIAVGVPELRVTRKRRGDPSTFRGHGRIAGIAIFLKFAFYAGRLETL